jgi:hypothetical protein
MVDTSFNKYRAAINVLQRGRDQLVESLAEEILAQGEDLVDNNFLLNEFLETQGTRLHFLLLVMGQMEQSADALDEQNAFQPRKPAPAAEGAKKRKPRTKKMPQKASTEGTGDEL